MTLVEAPKQFWYFAGVALLIVAAAVAWRIVGNDPVAIHDGDFSLNLGAVQRNITDAQNSVQAAAKQAEAQRGEIEQLEERLKEEHQRVLELSAEIKKIPQASASQRALALRAESAPAPSAPAVSRVDSALFASAQVKLLAAQRLATQLAQRH